MTHLLAMRMRASSFDRGTNLQTKVTSKYLEYFQTNYSLKMPNDHVSPPNLLLLSLKVNYFCRTQHVLSSVKVIGLSL